MLNKIDLLKPFSSHLQEISQRARSYYINTPLLHSLPLSKHVGKPVYLKLDYLQPSGSFKDRGMSHLLSYEYFLNNKKEFISSSGGNAGLACATVSNKMGVPCHVIVPKTTSNVAISRIEAQNARVTIHGNNWNEADSYARELIASASPPGEIGYIHPFDHVLLWYGHSSLINEIINDKLAIENGIMQEKTNNNDCIICSVGGGGLLNGICLGLIENSEEGINGNVNNNNINEGCINTTVITSETIGCDSFYQSYLKGDYVTLDSIKSIANTLGARKVQGNTLEHANMLNKKLIAQTVTDKEAVNAVKEFLNDHRVLVEPACAASLALVYEKNKHSIFDKYDNIIVEVCGGSGTNIQGLIDFCKQFDL